MLAQPIDTIPDGFTALLRGGHTDTPAGIPQRSLCLPSFYFRRLPRKLENHG